jgi:hypothetical protein
MFFPCMHAHEVDVPWYRFPILQYACSIALSPLFYRVCSVSVQVSLSHRLTRCQLSHADSDRGLSIYSTRLPQSPSVDLRATSARRGGGGTHTQDVTETHTGGARCQPNPTTVLL